MNKNWMVMSLIILLLLIINVIFILYLNQEITYETKIVYCYDDMGNKILNLQCEDKIFIYPKYYDGLLISCTLLIIGLGISLGNWCFK